jgi:hypothetical protein
MVYRRFLPGKDEEVQKEQVSRQYCSGSDLDCKIAMARKSAASGSRGFPSRLNPFLRLDIAPGGCVFKGKVKTLRKKRKKARFVPLKCAKPRKKDPKKRSF